MLLVKWDSLKFSALKELLLCRFVEAVFFILIFDSVFTNEFSRYLS